jgi:uncharacterized lipoprotein YmbA
LLCGCLGIGGKKPQPVHFFVLGNGAIDGHCRLFNPEHIIVLERVNIPCFLDQVRIVTRDDGGKLVRHEFFRWGENLADGVGSTLRSRLEEVLRQSHVLLAPWGGDLRPDFRLIVAVDDFTARGDRIWLNARCEYWHNGENRLVGVRSFCASVRWEDGSADALVDGMRSLLVHFADAIAADIGLIWEGKKCCPDGELAQDCMPEDTTQWPKIFKTFQTSETGGRELLLQARTSIYVTVDPCGEGERLFSGRLAPGQRMAVPCHGAVQIFASDPDGLLVDGQPLGR